MITDTFKVFKEQVESSFPNYMVDYSAANNRVFVFKDEEPFCIAKIFLERQEYVPGPCTHRPSHHESL